MKKTIRAGKEGFSLVESMVTIGIFLVVTSMIFANYPEFKKQISLRRTSQEIALRIREAQIYAMGVKKFGGVFSGYGIHFDRNTPSSFVLFADTNNNSFYDGISEDVKGFNIQTNDYISDLCGNAKTSPPGSCGLSYLDIIYLRPKPIVALMGDNLPFSDLMMTLRSSGGGEKKIIIWASGQITIE